MIKRFPRIPGFRVQREKRVYSPDIAWTFLWSFQGLKSLTQLREPQRTLENVIRLARVALRGPGPPCLEDGHHYLTGSQDTCPTQARDRPPDYKHHCIIDSYDASDNFPK